MARARECVDKILSRLIGFPYGIISHIKKHPQDFFLTEASRRIQNEEYEVGFRLIPKNNVNEPILRYSKKRSYAIVLQGPIRTEENFTVKTVEFYKSVYPDAEIIVSTWDNESADAIDALRKTGIEVVLSGLPEYSGILNVNFQLTNTLAGIKRAVELGVDYIAKTRTDQKINNPYAFEYMMNLLEQFPTQHPEKQNKRLVTLSMNYGNMFYPYFMSDFMYFGTAQEMLRLFDVPMDTRGKFEMPKNSTRREFTERMTAPEVFILKQYLTGLGYAGDNTVEDYWKAVKESLICVDRKTVQLVWPKYEDKYKIHEYFGEYFENDSAEKMKTMNFDFVNWFNLYSGSLEYKPEYEKYADVVFK